MEQKKNIIASIFDKPVLLLAAGFFLFAVSLTGMGLFFIGNNAAMVQNTIPPVIVDSNAVIPELAVQEPRIAAAIDMKTISAPTPAMLEKGKGTFTTICSSCHGPEGNGDGAAGVALNPKPRNFHATEGWKNGRKLSEMFKTLQFGIQGSGMPPYDYMSPEDRIAVISYVRTTFMKEPPQDSPAELAALDNTYKLSQGTAIPGQIPVSGAKYLLEKQNHVAIEKINNAIQLLQKKQLEDESAKLFFTVTYQPQLALQTILKNTETLQTQEQFKKVVQLALDRNGFNAKFVLLSDDKVSGLFQMLKAVLS
ncbi:MAG: cytochrome c [Ignavibacteria bacterium]|nr:cytochrome c [Ignavibacteria bacterium]